MFATFDIFIFMVRNKNRDQNQSNDLRSETFTGGYTYFSSTININTTFDVRCQETGNCVDTTNCEN